MTTKTCQALENAYAALQNELADGARAVQRRKVDNMTVSELLYWIALSVLNCSS